MQWDETMERVSLEWNTETVNYNDRIWKWKQKQPQKSCQEPSKLIIAQHCNSRLGTLPSHISHNCLSEEAELSNSSATVHLWCTWHITSIALHTLLKTV